jgi:thiamine-phosphate pyrophosphorylase
VKDFSLYVITDRRIQKRKNLEVVEEAIAGGASVIQLREKEVSTREFLEEALLLRDCTRRHGVLFIVNDRLDIALASDADGVASWAGRHAS